MTVEEQLPENLSLALQLDVGSKSIAGVKNVNEDAINTLVPQRCHALINKGISTVIADGVSSAEVGKQASEYAVIAFNEEYFRTPDTWSVKKSGQKTLSAINLNLYKKSHAFTQQEKGFLCTFSGLIVKSRRIHFFHAGDSRIYRLRGDEFTQLTRDHTVNIGGGRNILSRAVGMDNILQIDYGSSEAYVDDIYLLTTDGIHDFVSESEIVNILNQNVSSQLKCEQLVMRAKSNKSDDNISCAINYINCLPDESRDDFNAKLTRLPFPPDLEPGMTLDGYRVDSLMFASSRSQVYLVTDTDINQQMVMKTPSINFQDDIDYIDKFIEEEWIGKRINSPHVVKIITQNRERTCLYYLMEYVQGKSLDKWMLDNPLPTPKKSIGIIKQIAIALKAFHDSETIHQDLKPANIIIDEQRNIKVIDFGSVFVAGIAEIFIPLELSGVLGTTNYSDPYYLLGRNTGVQGDIYSLATIAYELFTGDLPYGEKIEQCDNKHDFDKLRYIDACEHNPIIPIWFDRALEKGVKLELSKRYTRLQDFIEDITHPNPDFLSDDPVIEQSRSLLFWQLICAFWVLTLIIVVVLFSASN